MADVFVSSLTSLWANAPTRTLQRLILGTKDLRRTDASHASLRANAADYRWTGGTANTQVHRRRLVNAYTETLSRELGIPAWSKRDDSPIIETAPRGTHLDPHVSAFLHSAALGAGGGLPSMAFALFPNFTVLDTVTLYLPVAFDGVFIGGPLLIGSAPRLAIELRELAVFLGIDVSEAAWWRTTKLVADTPLRRSLSNLQILAIACAESAAAIQPVVVA